MTNKTEPKIFIIEQDDNSRLDRWIKKQIPELTQGVLEKLIRLGKIKLNGKKTKSGERLHPQDVISIYGDITPFLATRTLPEEKELAPLTRDELSWFETIIIWEDEDYLVLNKPSGLAVQGGSKIKKHIDMFLQHYGQKKQCQYRLVHRIDKNTSGVLLVAKSSKVATYLTTLFKESALDKTYWAIVLDHPNPGYGIVKAPLIKTGFGDREKVVVDEKEGKKAVTHYRTIKRLVAKQKDNLTWIEACPETGRTHQIRVHCEHLGTPIVGDGKYGGPPATWIHKTLHLHARSIAFKDAHNNRFVFKAPPPEHFIETLKKYKIDWEKCE